MKIIPTIAVPSQSLSITLDGQACKINLYSMQYPGDILNPAIPVEDLTQYPVLYMDLIFEGVPVITGRICRNLIPALLDAKYYGFVGDFAFVDTFAQSDPLEGDDPIYTGLGSQFQMVYLEASDLP